MAEVIAVSLHVDAASIARLGNMIAAAGPRAAPAIARALNRTGMKTKTAMKRALVQQTGLKSRVIQKALKTSSAFAGNSSVAARGQFVIRSQGGNIRLKFFRPREAGHGVRATPWNASHFYDRAFTRVGWQRRHSTTKFHGNVMRRVGDSRYPIQAVKSGLDIPDEMVKGATRTAFFRSVQTELVDRMIHELLRVLPS